MAALADQAPLGDTGPVNFLAHLVLAPQTPEGLIGSIAPDMIRGPLPADLHIEVAESAREHQRIDRWTDAHAAFHQTRERLRACVDSRLAGIVADVLYDHVLASRWADWRSDSLEVYVDFAQGHLMDQRHLVPDRMQQILCKMIEEQWITSYATPHGIRQRLSDMSHRLAVRVERPIDMTVSAKDLDRLIGPIADDFSRLWPDLIDAVDRHRQDNPRRIAS